MQFLNVDLEIGSRESLTALIAELARRRDVHRDKQPPQLPEFERRQVDRFRDREPARSRVLQEINWRSCVVALDVVGEV